MFMSVEELAETGQWHAEHDGLDAMPEHDELPLSLVCPAEVLAVFHNRLRACQHLAAILTERMQIIQIAPRKNKS